MDAAIRKGQVRDHAVLSKSPGAHHLIVDVRPELCLLLYCVLPGHAEDTARPTATARPLMVIKGHKVEVRVSDVVSGFVVDRQDEPSLAL
ncbi:hypothetical protein P1J78_00245 [Psychromarinibacter sp. C21-152]|uniref:Uncharacterized protein n=1 Tax=Psychromarinibacter sediminicola TaxID=3033385 RepID=A0AAE3NRF2_9RHOB|nr:hypothetical protein [Psychromarinibacter sediminicola]MDF0599147.1 hypothetical protein [Psychromarinibacter sediminicola]